MCVGLDGFANLFLGYVTRQHRKKKIEEATVFQFAIKGMNLFFAVSSFSSGCLSLTSAFPAQKNSQPFQKNNNQI